MPAQGGPLPEPVPEPVPELSPTATLVLEKDWDGLVAMGAEGHEALVDALRTIAALPSSARDHATGDPDPHATFPLVLALVSLDDPDVPALFLELLRACPADMDPLRDYLMEGLARTGTPLAVETLLTEALQRAGSQFGNPAARLLAGHPSPSTVPMLLAHLGDDPPSARALVADLLGKIPDSRSVDPLVAALDDGDPGVRDSAATALGRIGDERAARPLLLIEERDRRTRRWGHASALFDGRLSTRLLALDALATGTDPVPGVVGEDVIAVEGQILERLRPLRDRYAAEIDTALAGQGHDSPTPLPATVLATALARAGVDLRGDQELVYRDDRGADLERDLGRCAALGCPVSGPRTGNTVDDPQGGQMWTETWTAQCTDGPVDLTITRRYTPMF